jgi:protocatechuate 3,4-dioxygenase beta subunit
LCGAERALSDYTFNHHTNDAWTMDTNPHDIFQKYPACALSPDATEGPFCMFPLNVKLPLITCAVRLNANKKSRVSKDVEGELVRKDLTDGQPGLPLHLKIRVKDIATCKDVQNVFVEVWRKLPHRCLALLYTFSYLQGLTIPTDANATGTYSGTGDLHGQTFGRGLQKTDDMGVVSFDTIFPGHYSGRASHVHVAVHVNAQAGADGSVSDNTVSMKAQIYFDQALIDKIEKRSPYNANTEPLTYNKDDGWLIGEAAAEFDPFVYWIPASQRYEDGLIAWITVGANLTARWDMAVADHRD